MFSATEELQWQRLAEQEEEFVQQLAKRLFQGQKSLPKDLTEDRFQLVLAAAVRDLPECQLKQALLQHISQHTVTIWNMFVLPLPLPSPLEPQSCLPPGR